ncbi:PREDICTED: C-C chemokine receptor type 9 [Crocodylus porosus]|nr:PREDICTED: C-C chemokine receptor type 9 [Crocodylus porosus]
MTFTSLATQNDTASLHYYMNSASMMPPDNNIFNDTDTYCEKSNIMEFAKTFLPTFFCLVFSLGTLGNALVILVYCKHRFRKSMTDRYLLHLAIADLLLLSTLPFWAKAALDGWIFKNVMCKIVNSMYKINFYSCMLFLMCISIDRYITIVQAMKAKNSRRKRLFRSKLICFAVWLTAIGLCIPEIVYSKVKQVSDTTTCKMMYPTTLRTSIKVILLSLKITIGFLLPFLVMVVCYALIIRTLRQTKKSQKRKSLKIIVIIITVFLLSQFPYNIVLMVKTIHTYSMVRYDCRTADAMDIGFQITQIIAFFHTCLNPALYVFVGQRFRNALIKILKNAAHCSSKSKEQFASPWDSQERSSVWSSTMVGGLKIRGTFTDSTQLEL